MNRVPIRIKMMLWYMLLTSALLAVFVPIFYKTVYTSLYNNQSAQLGTIMAQVMASVEVEEEIIWDYEDEEPLNTATLVVDLQGNIIFSNTEMEWIHEEPFLPGESRQLDTKDGSFLVLDEIAQDDGQIRGYARVCTSMTPVLKLLSEIRLVLLFAIPAYIAIAVFGSYWIAKRALKPIVSITKTAGFIQSGDLSRRIIGVESADEVGELAYTFNKMLEHLETAFRREKQFASDASHELRTPVAVVMAYSESLMEQSEEINEETLKAAEEIHRESRRMSTIISQLLMLTRGYEGRYPLELETVNLAEIIESVKEQIEERAQSNQITIHTEMAGNLMLTGDQSLLTQMLINLVENAVKYGREGGYVKVIAKAYASEIELSVSDNGIGIPAEEQQLVFERFYRADKARDRSGTGLGLSIVKWIVEEHKGKISITSALDKGTIFEVKLPLNERGKYKYFV